MQIVHPLPIEPGGCIKLQHIVFPVNEFIEGIVGKVQAKGILELMVYLFSQCLYVVFDAIEILLFLSFHVLKIAKLRCTLQSALLSLIGSNCQ